MISTLKIMNKIIELKEINKKYYNMKGELTAIEDISFSVFEGEYVAIVGPSGCGKSTLLNIIGNIDKKSGGEIILNKDTKIGYMLQEDSLFPWLTILDNCLIGLKVRGEVSDDKIDYVKKLLNIYGLKDFMNSYPTSLSGGMRQRVALIRTLAMKPDILLLDEPFSALDYQTRLAVSDDVYKIIKNTGKTVIMITHDIAEAISMADRVIVLTERPAKVKQIYNIEMEGKSTPIKNRKCREFSEYYDMIWKEIDYHEK